MSPCRIPSGISYRASSAGFSSHLEPFCFRTPPFEDEALAYVLTELLSIGKRIWAEDKGTNLDRAGTSIARGVTSRGKSSEGAIK
jgi:hypothetical protein